ncbi:MAG: hypothetical protein DHS20C18_48160 [Saprospiraceae bacterium]|nr:MAG: hypothetical protein DHS20C18_48160 [Saprospiraceae bacterium]
MFKLLITGAIIYFIYRFFIAPPSIEQPGPTFQDQNKTSGKQDNEEDYIDYEEVD